MRFLAYIYVPLFRRARDGGGTYLSSRGPSSFRARPGLQYSDSIETSAFFNYSHRYAVVLCVAITIFEMSETRSNRY